MRQITVILVTAALTAMVTVFSMMATSHSSRTSAEVRAPDPIDVMKKMRNAKDLPYQSYPAY